MGRGVKIVTEMKDEEVVLLKDVDVKFVSLVRHGANQSPFRVIKSDGGKDMPKVIQSIILPNGVALNDLAEKEGLAWLNDAKQDKVEKFDEYQKFEQIPEGDFADGSLQLVKIHENGSFATVGVVKDQNTLKSALTLGEPQEKAIEIQVSPMNEVIAEREGPSFVLTFRDMFEKELSSFLDVVRGAMTQSQSDTKKRKTAVMNALESFKSFLAVGLDELSRAGKKTEKEDLSEIDRAVEKILAAINKEKQEDGDMLFKTMEDFADAVNKILDEREKNADGGKDNPSGTFKMKNLGTGEEFEVSLEAKATDEGADSSKNTDPTDGGTDTNKDTGADPKDTSEKEDKDMAKKFEAMSKRIAELEGQLASDPAAGDQDDETQPGNGKDKKSPFAGMFTTGHAEGGLNRYM